MKRREFIKNVTAAGSLMTLFPADLSSISRNISQDYIEKRSLGRTGVMLSMIGFGGIIVRDATSTDASALVKLAIESGINYFDVAPSYGDAETKLGPALEPFRDDVFLACKTQMRTREEARKELEQSLKNLRTSYFDLYQHHAVTTMDDVETILGKDGAMETFLEARKEGKIRFLGFSAHSVEAALALIDGFDFDTILFPVNFATWHSGNFGPQVLEKAKEKGMGILALKAMARGPWPENADKNRYPKCWYEPLSQTDDILMGLRFTLSHPVTAAVPPGEAELFKLALSVKDRIKPLNPQEIDNIKKLALRQEPLFSYTG